MGLICYGTWTPFFLEACLLGLEDMVQRPVAILSSLTLDQEGCSVTVTTPQGQDDKLKGIGLCPLLIPEHQNSLPPESISSSDHGHCSQVLM